VPIVPPPPPAPIEAQPGHFPWTSWVTDGLGLINYVPKIQNGRNSVTPVANVVTALVVTFAQPFAAPPAVVCTPDTGQMGLTFKAVCAGSVTATQFTIYMLRTNTQATNVEWLAMDKDI